ncbi:hypothetical protein B7494_g4037 [Chlorociboria aeruginascens]|nr:hypothetical protein B7494_g4037 [Chlorociboria aeruginascens]
MSGNVIKKAIPVGKIIKLGVEIACEVATETAEWTRPSDIAVAHGPAFTEAVENSTKPLPPKTKKLISREGDHKSAGDPKDHITAVAYDAEGNRIETFILTPLRRSNHSQYSLGCSPDLLAKCGF